MSSHSEYPYHGYWTFPYADTFRDYGVSTIHLGRIGNSNNWILDAFTVESSKGTCVFTAMHCHGMENVSKFRVRYFLSFVNQNESLSKVMTSRETTKTRCSFLGPGLLESTFSDERNGWLSEGKLTVHFGIHVECVREENLWKFNFHDPILGFLKSNNMVTFEQRKLKDKFLHSHKLLLFHHSPKFSMLAQSEKNESKEVENWHTFLVKGLNLNAMEKCLQVIHGVRTKIGIDELSRVLMVAHRYKLHTVLRYCEQEMVKMTQDMRVHRSSIEYAIHYKLNHWLAQLLRNSRSKSPLKRALRNMDIDGMNGELMKLCVNFLMEL
ncbi:unnamed protein product [Caenorhabditis brenneri]